MRKVKRFLLRLWARQKKKKGIPKPLSLFQPEKVEKILVVSCTAIGDSLLSTPAIRATRELFPRAHITWLIKPSVAPLFSNNPHVDAFLHYRGGFRGIWKLLKRFQFDLVLDFHDSDEGPVVMACLAEVPFILRSALKDHHAAPFLSERIPYRIEAHVIEQRLDVLRYLLGEPERKFQTRLVLPVSPSDRLFAQKLLNWSGLKIGFQCRASRPFREWPLERFSTLVERLLRRFPESRIFLLGSHKDRSYLSSLERERVTNLAGLIPLRHLAGVVKELDLLVTVDTGPMHVAFAVGTPTVCLFVPSEVRHTGPYQDLERHRVIQKDRPCKPCKRKYCEKPWCMELISVEEVFQACEEALS